MMFRSASGLGGQGGAPSMKTVYAHRLERSYASQKVYREESHHGSRRHPKSLVDAVWLQTDGVSDPIPDRAAQST